MESGYRVVCWSCKKSNIQLFNVRDKDGKKTSNYVCVECKDQFPNPPNYNMSLEKYMTKREFKKMIKEMSEKGDIVTLEGDKIEAINENLPNLQ